MRSPIEPVCIRGFIPTALTDQFRTLLDDNVREIAKLHQVDVPTVERLVSVWGERNPAVRGLVDLVLPSLLEAFDEHEAFADLRPDPVDATLFVCSREHQGGTHAHQDVPYRWRAGSQRYAATTWIALDEATDDDGALLFSEGPDLAVRQDFLDPTFEDRSTTSAWTRSQRAIDVRAGDLVVFNSTTWHASARRRSDRPRRALTIRWPSRSGWENELEIPQPRPAPDHFGMDTSGRLFCEAVARRFPEATTALTVLTPETCVDWMVRRSDLTRTLDRNAVSALDDLRLALRLRERHHARPSASVWRRIRDLVMPALQLEEVNHGLA